MRILYKLIKAEISSVDREIRHIKRTGASAGPPIPIGFMIEKDEGK